MRFLVAIFCFTAASQAAFAQQNSLKPDQIEEKINKYFERFCDYTGGLGIQHVPNHAYDYAFRQQLKQTKDLELKRLYVLQHRFREIDWSIHDYRVGEIRIDKVNKRKLTEAEKADLRKQILADLDELNQIGDKNTPRWTKSMRSELERPYDENSPFK
jgi:hypothetical protein